MAQSLSNIASPDIKQPFGPQYTALTGKKPKVPLSSIIHAKIPGYMYSHEARLEREFAQEAHEEEMELAEKEMTDAEKQAEKATAIQATGIGGGLGYMMTGAGSSGDKNWPMLWGFVKRGCLFRKNRAEKPPQYSLETWP